MFKAGMNKDRVMMLARAWDLQGEPQFVERGAVFTAFGGKRLLRCVPMEEAAFGYYLQKHLYGRGFARGLRFIPDKYGDAYDIWEDKGVYLIDYYENAFALRSEYDLWRMAALLADFHNAAEGLTIPGAPLEEVNSPLAYAFWLTEQPPPPMSAHMLPVYERLCGATQDALEHAEGEGVSELCAQAQTRGSVIQGRFNESSLCEYYGELLISDYAAASYGLPVWDLAYLLNRGLLLLPRPEGALEGAVREYEKRRRLSPREKQLLGALAELPMDFVFAISDWREQKLNGEAFAEIMLLEDKRLPLRRYIGSEFD